MSNYFYAEDDAHMQDAVKNILEQKNFKVVLYHTIFRGQTSFGNSCANGYLIRRNMGGWPWDSLCQWIRAGWKELPVIFLTVRMIPRDIVSGFQNGAGFINVVKPFELSVLVFKDSGWLHRRTGKCCGAVTCPVMGIRIDYKPASDSYLWHGTNRFKRIQSMGCFVSPAE